MISIGRQANAFIQGVVLNESPKVHNKKAVCTKPYRGGMAVIVV